MSYQPFAGYLNQENFLEFLEIMIFTDTISTNQPIAGGEEVNSYHS